MQKKFAFWLPGILLYHYMWGQLVDGAA